MPAVACERANVSALLCTTRDMCVCIEVWKIIIIYSYSRVARHSSVLVVYTGRVGTYTSHRAGTVRCVIVYTRDILY